jgi:hypothetical protein
MSAKPEETRSTLGEFAKAMSTKFSDPSCRTSVAIRSQAIAHANAVASSADVLDPGQWGTADLLPLFASALDMDIVLFVQHRAESKAKQTIGDPAAVLLYRPGAQALYAQFDHNTAAFLALEKPGPGAAAPVPVVPKENAICLLRDGEHFQVFMHEAAAAHATATVPNAQ